MSRSQTLTKPSIAEVKAIAEEGFIYGLPIVMNYVVMYEFSVDKDSGQYKAPFNEIDNSSNVFPPTRTQPSSPLTVIPPTRWLPSICDPSRTYFRCPPWRKIATIRFSCATAIRLTTDTLEAAPRAMNQAITWLSAPIGKASAPRHQANVSVVDPILVK